MHGGKTIAMTEARTLFNPAVGQDQGKQRRRIATLTLIKARAPWRLSLHGEIQEVPFNACAPDHVAARGHGGR
jgi:hypothetical protein